MTCERLPQKNYQAESTSSTVDSHVRISASQEIELAWQASAAGLSAKCGDWLMRYDRVSSSWKTSQQSLPMDLVQSLPRLPVAGLMRDGYVYPLPIWERVTSETDGGYLPTIRANSSATGDCNHNPQCHPACKPTLQALARTGRLPTLTARDWKDGTAQACANVPENALLGRVVHRLRTPNARDYKSWKDGDREANGKQIHLPAQLGGRLSPLFVEQMMGYRTEWTELNAWGTQWFRNARKRHSKSS